MKQVRIVFLIISAVFILCGLSAGQSRTKPKAKAVRYTPSSVEPPAASNEVPKYLVTVKLKKGGMVIGSFLRADTETVQIDLNGQSKAFKLNEVDSITFTPNEVTAAKPALETTNNQPAPVGTPAPDPILVAGRRAYSALRKLTDAAQIGLPYGQYANLLIETRPVLTENLRTLPDGALKADLAAAMEAYMDAGQAWGAMQGAGVLPIATEPGATLMKKYSIKPGVNALGQEDRLLIDTTVPVIWAVATERMNNLAGLLKL
jgi:hypothetical protein